MVFFVGLTVAGLITGLVNLGINAANSRTGIDEYIQYSAALLGSNNARSVMNGLVDMVLQLHHPAFVSPDYDPIELPIIHVRNLGRGQSVVFHPGKLLFRNLLKRGGDIEIKVTNRQLIIVKVPLKFGLLQYRSIFETDAGSKELNIARINIKNLEAVVEVSQKIGESKPQQLNFSVTNPSALNIKFKGENTNLFNGNSELERRLQKEIIKSLPKAFSDFAARLMT